MASPSTTPQPPQAQEATQSELAPDENTAQGQIEVDSDLARDEDSSYGDEVSSYTASLTSSVTNYQYEHGRRYHGFREGKYVFPNDEAEQDRLDIHHHMIQLRLDGRLHLAPIGNDVQRILDLGTGTGIWAIEMGDKYPSAEIIGNDLSPVQPSLVPPNVRFIIDDIEDEWAYDAPFDYIHARYLAVSIKDWPKLMERTYKNTKPGGWAEFQDWDITYYSDDNSLAPDSAMRQWDDLCIEGNAKNGRDSCPGPKLKQWMIDAGFKNVRNQILKLPLGPWPKDKKLKDIGIWNKLQIQEGMEAFTLALFTRVLDWSAEEVQVLLANVRNEFKDSRIHVYYNFHVAYGQRPEDSS